ncbi:MAG TPA: transposase [Cyclobacteriaceae bacterium]|nr:transposase [Cyclobacteriaceae bacterium]
MTRRKWSSEQKLQIVLEGLSGKLPLSQLCAHHQISQAQFYQWKDRLLKEGSKIFEHGGVDKQSERLKAENRQLKGIIGELTIELKKSDQEWL